MTGPLVVALPGQEGLGNTLARVLSGDTGALELRRFPDGETYVRLADDCENREVVIAATLVRPDELVVPLIFTARGLREQGARRLVLVAPYLAYLRQDARFRPGEVVSSRWFAELLSDLFDGVVTVDPHLHRYRKLGEVYRVPTRIVHAAPALARWIVTNVDRPLLIGPDSESEQWVSEVARFAAAPHAVLSKTRRGDRDVAIELPPLGAWRGRTPVLVDDIISTARTMIEASRRLREAGCAAPVCLGVHAVFAGQAYEDLLSHGVAAVVTTDSVAHPTNRIELGADVGEAVRVLLEGIRGAAEPAEGNISTCS